jgi:hypothetical protein
MRTKHPLSVPRTSTLPFDQLLCKCLVFVNYLRFEMIDERGFSEDSWKSHLVNMAVTSPAGANVWGKPQHDRLTKFMNAGGYDALKAKKGDPMKEKVMVGALDADGAPVGLETIELELDELGESIDTDPELRRPQLSPRHELEEVVADGVLRLDPRFGVW